MRGFRRRMRSSLQVPFWGSKTPQPQPMHPALSFATLRKTPIPPESELSESWAVMASRCQFENSNDVGVFANLTSSYCITALGAAENFYRQGTSSHAWAPISLVPRFYALRHDPGRE